MSAHVWDVKKYGPSTVALAARVFRWCQDRGAGYEDALRFVGYAMERIRQGANHYHYHWRVPAARQRPTYEIIWDTVARSGHRYRNGRRGPDYRAAGVRLLEAAVLELTDLRVGTPANVVWDRMLDQE